MIYLLPVMIYEDELEDLHNDQTNKYFATMAAECEGWDSVKLA